LDATHSDIQALIERARRHPEQPTAHLDLGVALQQKGLHAQAEHAFRRACSLVPHVAEIAVLLGDCLSDQKKWAEAEAAYHRAISVKPDLIAAWNNLGASLRAQKRYVDAVAAYKQVLMHEPSRAVTWRNLGSAIQYENLTEEAVYCCEKAVALEPQKFTHRWTSLRVLPILYRDSSQVEIYRKRYARLLSEASEVLRLDTQAEIQEAEKAIWDAFHLHYQGQDDRTLQAQHGQLIHRILSAAYPDLAEPPAARASQDDRPIRVGFVSSMLKKHTITVLFRGWIEQLCSQRFALYGYLLDEEPDEVTAELAQHCTRFVHLPNDIRTIGETIRKDALDVLIYPELGMNRHTLKLAALRLAPVQCVTWGHPVTTGLPTIDYFLSGQAMEGEDADRHYTETLIRLPGLSLFIQPPNSTPKRPHRERFGLSESAVIYLIPQSLFKLLPRFDYLYPAICEQVPNATFVFIANEAANGSEGVRKTFDRRMSDAFAARGLTHTEHVHILPGLSPSDFRDLNHCADLFLDAPAWSGGRTTLEAVAAGLLPLTLPGPLMRQRHTRAILHILDLHALIAKSEEDYIHIASRLGNHPEERHALQKQLVANRMRLYEHHEVIEALQDFLQECGTTPTPPLCPA